MFKFDEGFWKSINAGHFSEEKKKRFEAVVREELETRVGKEISKNMTNAQLSEFDDITEKDADFNLLWLEEYYPDFRERTCYGALKRMGYQGDDLINEIACVLWLQANKPDYADIANKCKNKMRREIIEYFS